MFEIAYLDSKGRITLPKGIRKVLGINPGDKLKVMLIEDRVVIEKMENPFKVLEIILKDFRYDLSMRAKAEEMALDEAKRRAR
ncbi:MAG: AbrB/MazE/SpoVT family DNA-binding domain-containing protein [Candidatus Bathyarchaeia archaeon]